MKCEPGILILRQALRNLRSDSETGRTVLRFTEVTTVTFYGGVVAATLVDSAALGGPRPHWENGS
jgi:hypothetical protein